MTLFFGIGSSLRFLHQHKATTGLGLFPADSQLGRMSRRSGSSRMDNDFIVADGDPLSDDSEMMDGPGSDESDLSEAEEGGNISGRRVRGSPGKSKPPEKGRKRLVRGSASRKGKERAWEAQFEHTWDSVREDDRGTLEGAVSDMLLSSKTKRTLRDTSSIQRGIIRHVYLVIDLSLAMLGREYKLTWLDLTLQYAREFVNEFFDQNPISQLAIIVTRDGSAERLSPLSGNPVDHIKVLENKKKLEVRGEPSLQNVLEMARAGLSHLPPHGSREVIIILGSLTTCDPGNIHTAIDATLKDRVRVNILGLSAEMKICKDICQRTKGVYAVAKDDLSLRELLFEFVAPPPTLAPSKSAALGGTSASTAVTGQAGTANASNADLMLMGFPTLVQSKYPGLCSCHQKLKSVGYSCPRCKSRICDVPTECRVCSLTAVSSPHLARSYRHLFPVVNFELISKPAPASKPYPPTCYSCAFPFTTHSTVSASALSATHISPLGRYACKKCGNHFCLDCDQLIHDALGFCPGCEVQN